MISLNISNRRLEASNFQNNNWRNSLDFTHFDDNGNAIMVDVAQKQITMREAVATGIITMDEQTMEAVKQSRLKKGDVIGVARVAGIMAAKKTSDIIPLCHQLNLTKVSIDFEFIDNGIKATCLTKTTGQTGVEMEALTGVTASLLTIYDMCKAIDKTMVLTDIKLEKKSGGRSGEFIRENS